MVERSSERREFGVGDAELESDLFSGLLNFAILGVAGDDFPEVVVVVSDTLVLFPQRQQQKSRLIQRFKIGAEEVKINLENLIISKSIIDN